VSLINQMLRDLDARSSDLGAESRMHGEVRAAPERDGIHPVWWLTLVLALLVAGGAAWLWWRQSPPAVRVVTPSAAPQAAAAQPAPSTNLAQATGASDSAPQAGSVIPSVSAAPPAAATTQSDANIALNFQLRLDPQLNYTAPVNAVRQTKTASAANAKPSAVPRAKVAERKSAPSAMPATSSDSRTPADIVKEVKELSPQQQAENEYRKAISLLRLGRVVESIDGLKQTLQLNAQHAPARQSLVELLLESRRHNEAIFTLQDGLGLDLNQPELAMILARLQVEKGEIRPAADTLQRTLPHAVDRAEYQAFLAALLQREGLHKDAIEHYGLALRKMPENAVWWMGLGISLRAENRLPEARDAFGRAKSSNTLSSELLAFVEQQINQLR
jgi:MSHA biogenesis protein MshN